MRKTYTITASATIGAPAEIVYRILADYHEGHPHILPRKYFTFLAVELQQLNDFALTRRAGVVSERQSSPCTCSSRR